MAAIKDPILEAATTLETIRFDYERVINSPMPETLEERIQWQASRARLGIQISVADTNFARVIDEERVKAMQN
jgi:hypothetical protein